ncbi:MAG: dihydroorotate dehydrogenase [Chloroflexota bacterium]
MLELTPQHKIGLSLANPVMIASGCAGYGPAYQRLLDLSVFGAIVTNPITLRPRRGTPRPRLAETKAGFILETGQQNPGVRKVIRQYGRHWSRLGVPIIAHLPADEPDDLRRTAGALVATEAIAAIELGLPAGTKPADLERWLGAVRDACLLPVLVKLPLETALNLARPASAASADALVIGSPLPGAALAATGEWLSGPVFGPMLHSLTLHCLRVVRNLTELPLVAVGGIHTLADAQALLQAGAGAVQLDSLVFIDPKQAQSIAQNIGYPLP